jgi:hypothetical protein
LFSHSSEKNGLTNVIRWELPNKLRLAIDNVLTTQDWDAFVKISWDPTHVEFVEITVIQVKAE